MCGHGDPTLSLLDVVKVIPLLLAGCGHGDPTLSMQSVIMMIPL